MTSPHDYDRRVYRSGRQKLLFIGFCVAGFLGLAGAAWFLFGSRPPVPTTHTVSNMDKGRPYTEVTARLPAPKTTPKQQVTQQFRSAPHATTSAVEDPVLVSPINVKNQGQWKTFIQDKPQQTANRGGGDDDPANEGEDNPLSQSLKRSNLGKKSIGRIDRDYLYEISAGRRLACNTTSSTNSQLLGFVNCDIQGDVYNDSGTGLLLKNGTHVRGEYKQAILHGNNRLFVLWTEIRTDDTPPCKIPINSPGADQLGAAGQPMEVDDHFWSIFWATAVYTVLDAAPALGVAALQNAGHGSNGASFYPYYQLTNPGQNMGSRMLQDRMNQPPTGEAHLGEPLIINVGTDISMRNCIHFDFARSR